MRGWRRCLEYLARIYKNPESWEYVASEGGHVFFRHGAYLGIPIQAGDYEQD